jgi:hypothetical protein
LPFLRNCVIRDNFARNGAGLHAQPASANLRWCQFIDNRAINNGGGLWGQAINYKISHCLFRGNTAVRGGGVYLHSTMGTPPGGNPIVLIGGSVFHDNFAERGGAVYLGGSEWTSGKATISNCTIAYNSASITGAMCIVGCGSQRKWISGITEPEIIQRILDHLELPSSFPAGAVLEDRPRSNRLMKQSLPLPA